MSRHEPETQFRTARAVAAPISFAPQRDRWIARRRMAVIAAATLGLWALLLAPGGLVLA